MDEPQPEPESNLLEAALFFALAPLAVLAILVARGQWELLFHLLTITLIVFFCAGATYGWGIFLCRQIIFRSDDTHNDSFAAAVPTGLTFVYLFFVALAAMGIFRPFAVISVLAGGVVALALSKKLPAPAFSWNQWPSTDRWLLRGLLLMAGLIFVHGWSPLVFYDSLIYQAFAPLRYLAEGKFVYIPMNFGTNTPMALQFLFGSSLAMDRSGDAFKLLMTLAGLLMIPATASLAGSEGRRSALIAGSFVAAYPGFWLPHALGTVDLPVAAALLGGAVLLRQAMRYPGPGQTIPAACCLGLAVSSRYTAIPMAGVIIVTLFLTNRFYIINHKKKLFLISGIALLMLSPWLIKNAVFTGNPIYPLLVRFLGGKEWSIADAARLTTDNIGAIPAGGMLRVLYIFRLMWDPKFNGILGIVCFACSLFLLFKAPRSSVIRQPITIGFCGLLLWGLILSGDSPNLWRFNAVTVAFFLAAGGVVFAGTRLKSVPAALLIIVSAGYGVWRADRALSVLASITDQKARMETIRNNVPGWDAFSYANKTLNPKSDSILLFGETRLFFLRIPALGPDAYHGTEFSAYFAPSFRPDLWTARLRSQGVTHILVNLPETNRLLKKRYLELPESELKEVARWLSSQPVLYHDSRGNRLLSLK